MVRYRLKGDSVLGPWLVQRGLGFGATGAPPGSDNPKEDVTGQVTQTILIDLPHN